MMRKLNLIENVRIYLVEISEEQASKAQDIQLSKNGDFIF